jgi:hypothetical protein
MGRTCREIHDWIEEEVERPIEEWEDRQEERCRNEPCKWWMLCLNKLFCWLVWVTVKVTRWIVVTVGKWVTRVVCTIVNVILDVIGFIVGLILAIPIIGGIIRTILNWLTELIWRIVGIFDFIGSLIGIRPRKKMYFSVIIPVVDGRSIVSRADVQPQVDAVISILDRTCNIDARFTGFCEPERSDELVINCNAGGFFEDWLLKGSWIEYVSNNCKFESNWRRVVGYGGELLGFVANNITPDGTGRRTTGCSMAGTHNYVAIEAGPDIAEATLAHEFGHACLLLFHNDDPNNLMFESNLAAPNDCVLNNLQRAVFRSSRHVVYL